MAKVRSKITAKDLYDCFKQLEEFNGGDKDVIMFHPNTREYKVLPVALEYDGDNDVYGDPYIVFKRYNTVIGARVWKLETKIDIVDRY